MLMFIYFDAFNVNERRRPLRTMFQPKSKWLLDNRQRKKVKQNYLKCDKWLFVRKYITIMSFRVPFMSAFDTNSNETIQQPNHLRVCNYITKNKNNKSSKWNNRRTKLILWVRRITSRCILDDRMWPADAFIDLFVHYLLHDSL